MNKNKFKVLTILGTRPEIIRLSRVLPTFDKYFDHKVFYTGQNYDENLSDEELLKITLQRLTKK